MMVTATFRKIVSPCWKPSVVEEEDDSRIDSRIGNSSCQVDGLLWYKDSGLHLNGEFSMAVLQANNELEDCSQVESGPISSVEMGPQGTFVGIYDGHAGPEASRFVCNRLFENVKSSVIGSLLSRRSCISVRKKDALLLNSS